MATAIQKLTHKKVLKILPKCYISLVSKEVTPMKFIELCIRTQYETLKLPSDQMLKITSECLLHIKEVSKVIYIACIIANPLSIMISKLPLRVQRKILEAPLIKSLKQLVLVTSMMRIMRYIVDVKAN